MQPRSDGRIELIPLDATLLDSLERIRNGANTHAVSNFVATYRSWHGLLTQIHDSGDEAHVLACATADFAEAERRIRAFVYNELRRLQLPVG